MKKSFKNKKGIMKIYRKCCLCGKRLVIKVYQDGYYNGGHYWCELKIPIKDTGEYKKVGTYNLGKHKADVVKWTGKSKKLEMWDCNVCFQKDENEAWLEQTIEKLYGERCKDYEPNCACCSAWDVYDSIIDEHRDKL